MLIIAKNIIIQTQPNIKLTIMNYTNRSGQLSHISKQGPYPIVSISFLKIIAKF